MIARRFFLQLVATALLPVYKILSPVEAKSARKLKFRNGRVAPLIKKEPLPEGIGYFTVLSQPKKPA